MFCEKCGAQIPENGVCPNCSEVVETAEVVNEEVKVEETVAAEVVVEEAVVEVPAVDPGKTFGLIALIAGIASLVLGSFCSCLFACLGGILPCIAAIAAGVLGAVGMVKSKQAGFSLNVPALVGVICAVITFVVVIAFVILNGVLGGVVAMSMMTY